jgi:hypothetical protein
MAVINDRGYFFINPGLVPPEFLGFAATKKICRGVGGMGYLNVNLQKE